MPSIKSYAVRDLILSGQMDSSALETFLGNPINVPIFLEICNSTYVFDPLSNYASALGVILASATARTLILSSPEALRSLANSPDATSTLIKTTNGALLFAGVLRDMTGAKFSHWRNYANNYQVVKLLVNASGSKLKRQIFLSSGTWTAPGTPPLAQSGMIWGGGAGGNGAGGTNNNGGATSFGTETAQPGQQNGNGGGTTTNGGWINFTDTDIMNAPFQVVNASNIGGSGGSDPSGASLSAGDGGDGLPGSGGGAGFANPNTNGRAGRNYCGGGGGGIRNAGGSGSSQPAAPANSGSGGGGLVSTSNSGARGGGGGEIKAFNLDVPFATNKTVTIGIGGVSSTCNGGSGGAITYWLEA